MNMHSEKPKTEVALVQLIPNMMTIAAVCAGLSAIRFGMQGNHTLAVQLIIFAAILDGLDGRLARMMSSDSKLGAELDSLADFLNFGVAPALVLYFWALQDYRGFGWLAVLIFAVCCVLRLARFNVASKAESEEGPSPPKAYFVGVPSPAGALLVMWPLYVSFAYSDAPLLPDAVIGLNLVLVGILMISRVPVWSFKTTRIPFENVKFVLLGGAMLGAALLMFPWSTLIAMCIAYTGLVLWCARPGSKTRGL